MIYRGFLRENFNPVIKTIFPSTNNRAVEPLSYFTYPEKNYYVHVYENLIEIRNLGYQNPNDHKPLEPFNQIA